MQNAQRLCLSVCLSLSLCPSVCECVWRIMQTDRRWHDLVHCPPANTNQALYSAVGQFKRCLRRSDPGHWTDVVHPNQSNARLTYTDLLCTIKKRCSVADAWTVDAVSPPTPPFPWKTNTNLRRSSATSARPLTNRGRRDRGARCSKSYGLGGGAFPPPQSTRVWGRRELPIPCGLNGAQSLATMNLVYFCLAGEGRRLKELAAIMCCVRTTDTHTHIQTEPIVRPTDVWVKTACQLMRHARPATGGGRAMGLMYISK